MAIWHSALGAMLFLVNLAGMAAAQGVTGEPAGRDPALDGVQRPFFDMAPDLAMMRSARDEDPSLYFESDTRITFQGRPLSLCVRVDQTFDSLLYMKQTGRWVLADNGCVAPTVRKLLSFPEFEAFRSAEAIPLRTPDRPLIDGPQNIKVAERRVINWYTWGGVAALLLLTRLIRAKFRKLDAKTGPKAYTTKETIAMRKAAEAEAEASARLGKRCLAAMCLAARADGSVSLGEISRIKTSYGRATGGVITEEEIRAALVDPILADTDGLIKSMRRKLDPRDRQLIIRAMIVIAAVDDAINDAESAVIRKMATGLKLPGDELEKLLADQTAKQRVRPLSPV